MHANSGDATALPDKSRSRAEVESELRGLRDGPLTAQEPARTV